MEQFVQVKNAALGWCGNVKDSFSDYMEGSTVKTRRHAFTTGVLLFLLGVVIGFLISPVKKGISICSNNTDSFSANEAHNN